MTIKKKVPNHQNKNLLPPKNKIKQKLKNLPYSGY